MPAFRGPADEPVVPSYLLCVKGGVCHEAERAVESGIWPIAEAGIREYVRLEDSLGNCLFWAGSKGWVQCVTATAEADVGRV